MISRRERYDPRQQQEHLRLLYRSAELVCYDRLPSPPSKDCVGKGGKAHFGWNSLVSWQASIRQSSHSLPMLIEAYIEALLANEELADLVWGGLEYWDNYG